MAWLLLVLAGLFEIVWAFYLKLSEGFTKLAPSLITIAAMLVSFGNSSGKVEPFSLHELTRRGSLYVTRPTLYDFIGDRASLEAGAAELFELVEARRIEIAVNQTYALRDAAQAHRDLEARKTTGCTVLIP